MEPRLLLGASPLGWITALSQWAAEHGGALIVGQALTPDDVTGVDFDVLILDGWSSLLTRRLVDGVQRTGAAVLVLVDDAGPEAEKNRLADLGVSLSLPVSATPEQTISRAAEAAAVRRATRRPEVPRTPAPTPNGGRGIVLVGDDGVTEVAVNLAAAAHPRTPAVLADFDTVRPAVAQRLGLPVVPNVLTACDQLRRGGFDGRSVISHPAGFSVLPGLANPREWDELTSVDAGELFSALRDRFAIVVATVHPLLESLAPLSGLEGRFDSGRRLVAMADDVVVVGAGSPVGVVRVLGLAADVRAITGAPVHVVVNRAPTDAFRRAEWSAELTRTFTPASLSFLPLDRAVPPAAWDGRLPARGPFVAEIRRFAHTLGVAA